MQSVFWWLILFCLAGGGARALYEKLPVSGNYTCDELTRWIGTEKHYSNHFKPELFALLEGKNCLHDPVLLLKDISWHKGFAHAAPGKPSCTTVDDNVVVLLSNFSINNNFSHFLHALLRLFCALVDARWITWSEASGRFVQTRTYTIWLDEFFKLSDMKRAWIEALGGASIRQLPKPGRGGGGGSAGCVTASTLLYGSGCVKLLPPEKWFGYPGCRANTVLPAFGAYFRQAFQAPTTSHLTVLDQVQSHFLKVAFTVREATAKTGTRSISNLAATQALLLKTQRVSTSVENVTYEHLDVPSTVRFMAGVHIFVSMHGAGMTNMFFMNPGSAVVEIIPFPLCTCRSPDYFYGIGSYYHGSALAQGISHYAYCVPREHVKWHKQPDNLADDMRCSWRHLHAVESVHLDPVLFASLLNKVERDLVGSGTVVLTRPIINMNSHANG